jgi:uncharacterized spore protein YtfJ
MKPTDLIDQVRDTLTVKRVFGEPYEHNGVTIVPVATVMGGAGGGSGDEGETRTGEGAGYGLVAKPAGVYVIKDNDVRWQPAVDINRIVMGGQIVGVVFLLVLRSVLKSRR